MFPISPLGSGYNKISKTGRSSKKSQPYVKDDTSFLDAIVEPQDFIVTTDGDDIDITSASSVSQTKGVESVKAEAINPQLLMGMSSGKISREAADFSYLVTEKDAFQRRGNLVSYFKGMIDMKSLMNNNF